MIQELLEMVASLLAIYAAIGVLFAIYFVLHGARISDPGHENSSFIARAILTPGVIALWPYLLVRILSGAQFKG